MWWDVSECSDITIRERAHFSDKIVTRLERDFTTFVFLFSFSNFFSLFSSSPEERQKSSGFRAVPTVNYVSWKVVLIMFRLDDENGIRDDVSLPHMSHDRCSSKELVGNVWKVEDFGEKWGFLKDFQLLVMLSQFGGESSSLRSNPATVFRFPSIILMYWKFDVCFFGIFSSNWWCVENRL